MDRQQVPRNNEGFTNLYAGSQPFHAYDNTYLDGNDHTFNDASWGVNASNYPNPPSRVPQTSLPSWQPDANHLTDADPFARSLSHSPAPFGQNAFVGYDNQQQPYQYGNTQFDPALFNPSAPGQDFNRTYSQYDTQGQNAGTIAPQALEHARLALPTTANTSKSSDFSHDQTRFAKFDERTAVNERSLAASIPKGAFTGMYSVIDFDQLVRATGSERMGRYINIGKEPLDWPVNRTAALPAYVPRKSRKELRKVAANDPALLAKIAKRTAKLKQRTFSNASTTVRPFTSVKVADRASDTIKYEEEESSEEDSSDDDDDSAYTSGEDESDTPLPAVRPDSLNEGIEYDTIKAVWRSKRTNVQSATIKTGLAAFWEIVKTIKDRWRADAEALKMAEEKKRLSELPLLKSRVKDQRDMIETAFRTALKYGHKAITSSFAEIVPLLSICYQFLFDRVTSEDMNGSLVHAILELLMACTTLSDESLEKTKLNKMLKNYSKKANARTQHVAKQILANAASVSKLKLADPQTKPAGVSSKPMNAAPEKTGSAAPEPVAGVKRAASTVAEGGATKKLATGLIKPNGLPATGRTNGALPKTAAVVNAIKPVVSSAAVAAIKTKTVVAKPSNLFASLQPVRRSATAVKSGVPATASGVRPIERKSAPIVVAAPTNKTTFSFAETMANLTKPKEEKPAPKPEKQQHLNESAEDQAKRLRKEARRKLHVKFKDQADLVQIRYFTHDPDEELGHDSSQTRDVSDVGGEGRMLKMHKDAMDVDEDEEEVLAPEETLAAFKMPSLIDFSEVEEEERKRNYTPHGGGEMKPESSERTVREQYEANTLIVFYTDEKDIPPNPREPVDVVVPEPAGSVKQIAAPDEKYAVRARQLKASRPTWQQQQRPSPGLPPQSFNYASLANNGAHFAAPPPQHTPLQNLPAPDLQAILATLQQVAPQQAPPMMAYHPPAPAMPSFAPQPNGQQIDISSIMAALAQQSGAQVPQMGGYGAAAPAAAPSMGFTPQMQQQQQQQHLPYKVKVCRFWEDGTCQKGDKCTYLHEYPRN